MNISIISKVSRGAIILMVSTSLTGCIVRRVDFVWEMHISGSTVDARDSRPVDGTRILFYDEHVYPLSGHEVGRSEVGDIDVQYVYNVGKREIKPIWSRYKGLEGKFVLEFVHEGYQAESREFDFGTFLGCSPYLVDLGEVKLEPLNASAEGRQ